MLNSEQTPHGWLGYACDLQVNGGQLAREVSGVWNLDFSAHTDSSSQSAFTVEQCAALAEKLIELGILIIAPTIVTETIETWCANFAVLNKFRSSELGRHWPRFHLEAFFRPNKGYRGAHRENCCITGRVDVSLYQQAQAAADGNIGLVTVGPDVEGIEDVIAAALRDGARVSLGHFGAEIDGPVESIDPAEVLRINDCIQRCVDAGATLGTHGGNGTHPLLHRHFGHIGQQFTEQRMSVSLIADGMHLPESFLRTALAALGPSRTILTSDASALQGAPVGNYEMAGTDVEVVEVTTGVFKVCPRGEKELLAGSWVTLPACMNHLASLVANWGYMLNLDFPITIADICRMAWDNPLAYLGIDPGYARTLSGPKLKFDGGEFSVS